MKIFPLFILCLFFISCENNDNLILELEKEISELKDANKENQKEISELKDANKENQMKHEIILNEIKLIDKTHRDDEKELQNWHFEQLDYILKSNNVKELIPNLDMAYKKKQDSLNIITSIKLDNILNGINPSTEAKDNFEYLLKIIVSKNLKKDIEEQSDETFEESDILDKDYEVQQVGNKYIAKATITLKNGKTYSKTLTCDEDRNCF